MVRKLKHHERKLLRKVDFITYKSDNNHRDASVIRRYAIQKPSDYQKYNTLVGSIHKLAHQLTTLPSTSPFRQKQTHLLLSKLHSMGLLPSLPSYLPLSPSQPSTTIPTTPITNATLSHIPTKITVSAFCRRRLPVIMTKLHMAENVQAATKLVEQGHVRVGTETITDTAYLVTRAMEDWVTWSVGSKVRGHLEKFRGGGDDFELL